jgi:hypothetical protein
MVVTNGINVNIYDVGTHTWANVPINTPYDHARNTPTTAGAGRASHGCFRAPGAYVSPGVFADQLILNGQGNGATYGPSLNPDASGGRCEIRTHGAVAGTPVFKTGALDHSANLPDSRRFWSLHPTTVADSKIITLPPCRACRTRGRPQDTEPLKLAGFLLV